MSLQIIFQAFVQPRPDEDGGVRRIATDHWVILILRFTDPLLVLLLTDQNVEFSCLNNIFALN